MKNLLLIIATICINYNLFAQDNELKEIITTIKTFNNTYRLNQFLIKKSLIPPKTDTSNYFQASKVIVDIFRKNLFGDLQNEIIMQIRDERSIAVNIFHLKNEKLVKVPGNLIHFPEKGPGYAEQNYKFYFENIYKEDEFCIITTNYTGYNRTSSSFINTYRIFDDSIQSIYSFEGDYSSYSGVMTYNYQTDVKYNFQIVNNRYPKVLIKNVNYINEESNDGSSASDHFLSGKISEGKYIETISFANSSITSSKTDIEEVQEIFINSFDDIKELKTSKGVCNPNTVLFISADFFDTYLFSSKDTPELKPRNYMSDYSYYKCCHAYINNSKLFITSKKDSTEEVILSTYKLRPSVCQILKTDIEAQHLYYIPRDQMESEGKIVYNKTSKLERLQSNDRSINLCDPSLVYEAYKYLNKEVRIKMNDTGRKYIDLPLDKLAPYLKPEVLEEFKKCCKN